MKLGKIIEVSLREIWKHEEYDFTPWVASEDNISQIGDILGLSLTKIETEKPVG